MSQKLLGIDLTRLDTSPVHELGLIVEDAKGGTNTAASDQTATQPYPATGNPAGPSVQTVYSQVFASDALYKYVRFVGTTAANDWVIVDVTQTDEPCSVVNSSAVSQPIEGISLIAATASTYGWIQIRGRRSAANVATAAAAGDKLGTSAVSGRLATVSIGGAFSQAELQQVQAQGVGRGVIALDAGASNTTEVYIY